MLWAWRRSRAAIVGNAGPENVVVAALDDIDGVDLHVAEMLDRSARRLRPLAERRGVSSRWAAARCAGPAALVRGWGLLALRGIAGQCSRIRRLQRTGKSTGAQCFTPSPMLPVAISVQDALPRSEAWHL